MTNCDFCNKKGNSKKIKTIKIELIHAIYDYNFCNEKCAKDFAEVITKSLNNFDKESY